ncbi:MAG TPA: hypothetical protein ENN67_05810, partial [Firmicutes bacterium]|nr:hypothetical protein [Bacillota bacterium]
MRFSYLKSGNIPTALALVIILLVTGQVWVGTGCGRMAEPVRGSEVKLAKVDTAYVYEMNVMTYLEQFRRSRRARMTNFIGFTPDDILGAREQAIDAQIRKEIRRQPGVDILNSEITNLASRQVEE